MELETPSIRQLKSLEFYSGIGGMHYALQTIESAVEVLAAFDINTTANTIYQYNFPHTAMRQNNIESLTHEQLDAFGADLWTMSPPCQPFTKKGLQLGEADRRTDSFFRLMQNLCKMRRPPPCLFIENVVGFETSSVHKDLIILLRQQDYKVQEYILSPLQIGVPNTRPRYYLLAKRVSDSFCDRSLSYDPPCPSGHIEGSNTTVDSYLENTAVENLAIDASIVQKYGMALDVICRLSTRSACFTKSYGSYIAGCGSYVCLDERLMEGNRLTPTAVTDPDLTSKSIRRLSPREVGNFMCFPSTFAQPPGTTNKQMYRTLGNSVNVKVVATLLSYLLSEW